MSNLKLHQAQMIVYKSKHRFKCVCAGRRFGKTILSKTLIIKYATKPRSKVWYVAPTYRMAKQIMWQDLQDSLPKGWVKKINDTTMTIWLVNGSTIELKGADNPDCYDDQTEILTPDGWVFLKNLPEGLAVMTLNPQTNAAEWQQPIRYIHEPYSGPMYQVESKKLDLLVTPNHKFLVDTRKGVRKFKTLDKIVHQDRIPASVEWVGDDDDYYSHDMMAFMGLYLSEGCARKDPGPKKSYEIHFAQTRGIKGGQKGDVRADFIEVLNRLSISFGETEDGLRVYGKKWWDIVRYFGLAWEKRIPQDILDLPSDKLKTLLHWMIMGDGTTRRDGERVYYTTSYGMAGDVQEVCMKIGQSANVSEKAQTDSLLKCGRVITARRKLYQVNIYRNKYNHLRDTNEGSYVKTVEYSGSVHCVEVPNHTVYVRRNGKVCWSGNSLRGVGLDFLVLDEFQDMSEDTWKKVLRPTLADRKGHALFIGSPKGFSYFYEIYMLGQDEDRVKKGQWKSWQFPTIMSPFIPREEIEAARRDMDEKSFNQEFLADFTNMTGRVYHCFDKRIHVKSCPFNKDLPVWVGQDFNIDPMSAVIMQPQPDGTLWVVDEIVKFGSNTEESVDELERRFHRQMSNITIFPDPAGNSRQHARGETDLDIFRERGFKRIKHRTKHPAIVDRVNCVNRMLRAADGSVRLFVDESCKHMIESLNQTTYKKGTKEIDKGMNIEHSTDAAGYCIELQFPLRKIELLGVSL